MPKTWLGNDKYQFLSHCLDSTRVQTRSNPMIYQNRRRTLLAQLIRPSRLIENQREKVISKSIHVGLPRPLVTGGGNQPAGRTGSRTRSRTHGLRATLLVRLDRRLECVKPNGGWARKWWNCASAILCPTALVPHTQYLST